MVSIFIWQPLITGPLGGNSSTYMGMHALTGGPIFLNGLFAYFDVFCCFWVDPLQLTQTLTLYLEYAHRATHLFGTSPVESSKKTDKFGVQAHSLNGGSDYPLVYPLPPPPAESLLPFISACRYT